MQCTGKLIKLRIFSCILCFFANYYILYPLFFNFVELEIDNAIRSKFSRFGTCTMHIMEVSNYIQVIAHGEQV